MDALSNAPGWLPLATGAAGFVMQHISSLRENGVQIAMKMAEVRAKNSDTDLKELNAEDQSRDKAAKRASWGSRFAFGAAVIAAVIVFPALFSMIDGTVFVETIRTKGGQLWGLIPKKEVVEYVAVNGYVILVSYQTMFLSIGTFLLGRGAGK